MANCETCKGKEAHAPESVPYIVHESSMARMERQVKRGWIALIVAVALLFASNGLWLLAWNSYDYTSEEVIIDSQDGGNANYIGNDGDIVNGEDNRPQTNKKKEKRQFQRNKKTEVINIASVFST